MKNEDNKPEVKNAEIVNSSNSSDKNKNTSLGKFLGGVSKVGASLGVLLKSKKVQKGLLFITGIILKEVLKMPRGDGTGPFGGGGPGSGRGRGGGGGFGGGSGGGRGRGGGNRPGAGPGGFCVCPVCGEKVQHQAGVPCYSINCPECGARMVRG